MQDPLRPVTGYPVQTLNGATYACLNPPDLPPYQAPPLSRAAFLRRLSVVIVIIIGILLMVRLAVCPQLVDFTLQSLSVTNLNATDQRLTANWNARFHASKELSVSFHDVVSSVFYEDCFLTATRVGPFSQQQGTVDVGYSIVDSYMGGKVVDSINCDKTRGEVKFGVEVVGYVALPFPRGRRKVFRFWCGDVTLTGSSGELTAAPKNAASVDFWNNYIC